MGVRVENGGTGKMVYREHARLQMQGKEDTSDKQGHTGRNRWIHVRNMITQVGKRGHGWVTGDTGSTQVGK